MISIFLATGSALNLTAWWEKFCALSLPSVSHDTYVPSDGMIWCYSFRHLLRPDVFACIGTCWIMYACQSVVKIIEAVSKLWWENTYITHSSFQANAMNGDRESMIHGCKFGFFFLSRTWIDSDDWSKSWMELKLREIRCHIYYSY